MSDIVSRARAWDKFELGDEPPPPLTFRELADEIERLESLAANAMELYRVTSEAAVKARAEIERKDAILRTIRAEFRNTVLYCDVCGHDHPMKHVDASHFLEEFYAQEKDHD
jgi:hypothetical protein